MKTIAGVALAALMACGWAGAARASIVDVTFTIEPGSFRTGGVPPLGVTPSDFPVAGSASFEFVGTEASIISFDLSIGGHVIRPTGLSYTNNGLGVISSDPFPFFIIGIVLGKSYKTERSGLTIDGEDQSANPNFIICDKCVVTTSVSGTPIFSTPLPATAPLFGAAVLVLGAAGYGMRRRATAA